MSDWTISGPSVTTTVIRASPRPAPVAGPPVGRCAEGITGGHVTDDNPFRTPDYATPSAPTPMPGAPMPGRRCRGAGAGADPALVHREGADHAGRVRRRRAGPGRAGRDGHLLDREQRPAVRRRLPVPDPRRRGQVRLHRVGCSYDTATYKVDDSYRGSFRCGSGDYVRFQISGTGSASDRTLCLALNVDTGDCLRNVDDEAAIGKVSCTDPAAEERAEVRSGLGGEDVCGEAEKVLTSRARRDAPSASRHRARTSSRTTGPGRRGRRRTRPAGSGAAGRGARCRRWPRARSRPAR